MLYSVEQAFVGRDEIRALLKNASVGGLLKPCHRVIDKDFCSLALITGNLLSAPTVKAFLAVVHLYRPLVLPNCLD